MEKVDFTQGILAIQPDLHRFAYKLTADRESANDLVQDCLLQFFLCPSQPFLFLVVHWAFT